MGLLMGVLLVSSVALNLIGLELKAVSASYAGFVLTLAAKELVAFSMGHESLHYAYG